MEDPEHHIKNLDYSVCNWELLKIVIFYICIFKQTMTNRAYMVGRLTSDCV